MGKKIVITLAGDTSLGDWYIQKTSKKELIQRLESNPESFFNGIKTIITDSDYLILNLETVIANNPVNYFPDKKYPNWDKKERLIKLLKNIGTTAVGLANNHTMDFGPNLLLQTKKILIENGIHTFGAGSNIMEAEQPYKITLNGEKIVKNIYIIGGMNTSKRYDEEYKFFASEDNPGINSLNRTHNLIKKIRSEEPNSFIIVYPHWQGIDYKLASENSNIRSLCLELVECGANFIIGHGPHILNDFENNNQSAIAYSIGNFVFNSKGRYKKLEALPYSAIVRMQFEENEYDWSIEPRFYPIFTDNENTNYQTRAVNEYEYENLLEVLSEKKAALCHNSDVILKSGKDSHGFYFYTSNDNTKLSSSFHVQNIDNFNINNIIAQKPNDYTNETFSTSNLLAMEFEKKGYSSTRIGEYLIVNLAKEKLVFIETESSYDSSIGVRIAKDKTMMRIFLKKAGLSVEKGESFSIREKEKALNYALSLPASVIKPADGNKGRGISVGVKNTEEFNNAWNTAISVTRNNILVEEQFIGGSEARYLVVEGHCIAVYLRIPPIVVGNGIDTIETLIKQKNKYRLKNPNLKKILVKIDNHRLSIIKDQGYNLLSIPDKDVHVQIDWKGGLSTGAECIDITDETHPLLKEISEKAAKSIPGLFVAGIDIIAYDHFQKPEDKNYTIIEVNSRPGIGGHQFPSYGRKRNVACKIVEYCINRSLKERNESGDN